MTDDLTREDITGSYQAALKWLATFSDQDMDLPQAQAAYALIVQLAALIRGFERRLHMIATEATAPVRLPAPTTPSDGPEAQSDPPKP